MFMQVEQTRVDDADVLATLKSRAGPRA